MIEIDSNVIQNQPKDFPKIEMKERFNYKIVDLDKWQG